MKIRVRNNSIRLRLSQSEVRALAAGEPVDSVTPFGPGAALTHRVSTGGDAVAASLTGALVTISLPSALVAAWAGSDQLAVEGEQTWDGGSLRIQVEKDLACAKPRAGEDESDAYPNAMAETGHCR